MKKLLFHGFTAILLLAVLGVGAEVVVRLFVDDGMQYDLEMWKYANQGKRISENPNIGHEHRPGAVFDAMGTTVSINQFGMRGTDTTRTKPDGTYRILMIGDSLTFGWGVKAEETFSVRLSARLQAENPKIEVLNTGVGNTNTQMQAEYFLSKGIEFDPDLVVINYFINDAEPTPTYAELGLLSKYSYAWTYFTSRFDSVLRLFSTRKAWKQYYSDLYGPQGNWTGARAAIGTISERCKQAGCSVLLVNYPELRELSPYPFADVTAKLKAAADEYDIPFLDLLPSVADQDPATLWVTKPDPHPNGRANAFFADAIYEKLSEAGLAPVKLAD